MKNTNSKNPLVSVVMPVYNAGDFLVEAVESIRKQTLKNWELIAINDCSKDNSLLILQKFQKTDKRIKVINLSQKKGMAYALNIGIKKVKGQFIARMDADDISLPKRLEIQLNYLLKHPEIILVGTQVKMIDSQGKTIGEKLFPQDHETIYNMMMEMMPVQHATLMARTKILKKCYYQNHSTAEDVSIFFKLLSLGRLANTKEELYKYRLHLDSNSFKNPKKTFSLTIKSRIKAIFYWNYHPTIKNIIINIMQFIIITLLPNNLIVYLYELIRFKSYPIKKRLKHKKLVLSFK